MRGLLLKSLCATAASGQGNLNVIRRMLCPFGLLRHCLSTSVEVQLDYERDPLDDGKLLEKEASLSCAISQLACDFDRDSRLSLDRFLRKRHAAVIPTGSLKLDLALGIGGLPKGRMIEIFGKEASGKTTLALHVVKEAQKMGGCCAYIDAENALSPSLVEAMGVNTDKLLMAGPDCAENSLSIVNTLAKSGSVDVVVVDSVAALVPKCELEGTMYMNFADAQSKLMTRALCKIHRTLSRSETLVIFVNQVRTKLKSNQFFGGNNDVSCGGNALAFYSAMRIKISRRELQRKEDEVTGIGIAAQIMKNKLAPALKNASLDIEFGKGLCREAEILEIASSHGIILKEGNGYWIKGEFLKDEIEAETFLVENSVVADEICGSIRAQLFGVE